MLGHAGDAVGAAAGALVIQLDTRAAYAALIAANALSFLAYGARGRPAPARAAARCPSAGARRLAALRDGPYVALAAICGVLTLCWAMVSTALPLWVAGHTSAPRATSGVIVVVSSIAIAALQVRGTRAAGSPQAAARVAVLSGAALAASCVLFAAASGPAAQTAALLLLAGGVAHIAGELLFVAASWGLSVPLMPEGRAGEYQGVFATGEAAALDRRAAADDGGRRRLGSGGLARARRAVRARDAARAGAHAPGAAVARPARRRAGSGAGSGGVSVSCQSGARRRLGHRDADERAHDLGVELRARRSARARRSRR